MVRFYAKCYTFVRQKTHLMLYSETRKKKKLMKDSNSKLHFDKENGVDSSPVIGFSNKL